MFYKTDQKMMEQAVIETFYVKLEACKQTVFLIYYYILVSIFGIYTKVNTMWIKLKYTMLLRSYYTV